MAGTRRRAQDLTADQLAARRARDAARKRSQRGTVPRDIAAGQAGDNAVEPRDIAAGQPRDKAVDNGTVPRDSRGTLPRDSRGTLPRDTAGQPRDTAPSSFSRTRTDRREVSPGARSGRELEPRDTAGQAMPRDTAGQAMPRDTAGQNGARDTMTEPRDTRSVLDALEDDGHGAVWPDGRVPISAEEVTRRAYLHGRRAAARDWAAIDRCGLCDCHGFVVVDPGIANAGIPTVAFCSHLTTMEATTARADLDG